MLAISLLLNELKIKSPVKFLKKDQNKTILVEGKRCTIAKCILVCVSILR